MALARDAAAGPRGSAGRCAELPHDDPLALHVQLVQSQLVRKRHLGNTAAQRARRRHSDRDSSKCPTETACGSPSCARAPPPPRPAPSPAPSRPLPGPAPLSAAAIGCSQRHPRASVAQNRCQSKRALMGRAAHTRHVLHAATRWELSYGREWEAVPAGGGGGGGWPRQAT